MDEKLCLKDYIMKLKDMEAKEKKSFDGLIDKIKKCIEDFEQTIIEKKRAMLELEEYINTNNIKKNSKEFINEFNSIKSKLKYKTTQEEFIKIKNKINELRKIIN